MSGSSSDTEQCANPSPPLPPPPTYKVILIGDAGVGKTSLRQRYLDQKFSHAYRTTLGADFASRLVPVPPSTSSLSHPTQVRLQLWDTAGSERFRALGSAFYRGADACVLVYSATSAESLEHLKTWFSEFVDKRPIPEGREGDFVWACAGCKMDLMDDMEAAAAGGWKDHDAMPGESGKPAPPAAARELLASLIPGPGEVAARRPAPIAEASPLVRELPPGYTKEEGLEEARHERPWHPPHLDSPPGKAAPASTSAAAPPSSSHSIPISSAANGADQHAKGTVPVSLSESSTLSLYLTPASSMASSHTVGEDFASIDESDPGAGGSSDTGSLRTLKGPMAPFAASVAPAPAPPITISVNEDLEPSAGSSPPDSHHADRRTNGSGPDGRVDPGEGSGSNPDDCSDGPIPLFLTSSLTGSNVDALFDHLAAACVLKDAKLRRRTASRSYGSSGLGGWGWENGEGDGDEGGGGAAAQRERATVRLREVQANNASQGWRRCCA